MGTTKGMLSASKVYALLREKGMTDVIEELKGGKAKPIKLARRDVKKIEEDIQTQGIVVLLRKKSNPSDFEFVNPKYVRIAPRRHFEKQGAAAEAARTLALASKENGGGQAEEPRKAAMLGGAHE